MQKLQEAVERIKRQHREAEDSLHKLRCQIPALLVAWGKGEDSGELEAARQEIIRLQHVVREPHHLAVEILSGEIMAVAKRRASEQHTERRIAEETEFRKLFNQSLENPPQSVHEWQHIKDRAEHWHRQDVSSLERLLNSYEMERWGISGVSFAEYCAQNGLTPYNVNVTEKTISLTRS